LNRTKREAEADALSASRLDHENARRAALGLAPLASIDELETAPTTDSILLVQATRMVAEMASLQAAPQRELLSTGDGGSTATPPL
jgi:hypothetical protein